MPIPNFSLLIRAVLVWVLIMLAETVHGVLRRLLLTPDVAHAVRQISVLVGVVIIVVVAWLLRRWIASGNVRQLVVIGVLWAVLTLVYEFSLGLAFGMSWPEMLADYDLTQGGIMSLGLLAMALTPWLVQRLDRRQRAG